MPALKSAVSKSGMHVNASLERPPERDAAVKNPILVRERRAALVRAAIDVFAEKGYHAARVADVARAAGIAPGTVYNYVGSKEDLLHMVVADHLYGYERIVKQAMENVASPKERLKTLLRATIEAIFSYRKHYLVMVRELHHVGRERRRAFMRLAAEQRQICEDLLREIAADEGLDIGNPLITANLMIFLPSFVIARGWDLRGKVSDDEIAEALMGFMLRGLGRSD
jgi:TetR/AcrR family transcriptional regulator, cholesterol catabolism regulator